MAHFWRFQSRRNRLSASVPGRVPASPVLGLGPKPAELLEDRPQLPLHRRDLPTPFRVRGLGVEDVPGASPPRRWLGPRSSVSPVPLNLGFSRHRRKPPRRDVMPWGRSIETRSARAVARGAAQRLLNTIPKRRRPVSRIRKIEFEGGKSGGALGSVLRSERRRSRGGRRRGSWPPPLRRLPRRPRRRGAVPRIIGRSLPAFDRQPFASPADGLVEGLLEQLARRQLGQGLGDADAAPVEMETLNATVRRVRADEHRRAVGPPVVSGGIEPRSDREARTLQGRHFLPPLQLSYLGCVATDCVATDCSISWVRGH